MVDESKNVSTGFLSTIFGELAEIAADSRRAFSGRSEDDPIGVELRTAKGVGQSDALLVRAGAVCSTASAVQAMPALRWHRRDSSF